MLNRLTVECIGSKKRFTARLKLVVCHYKISHLKNIGMACFHDHSEMKKRLISKGFNFYPSVITTWHLAQSLLKTYSGNIKRTVNTD